MQVHLQNVYVLFVCQGHWVKVKVTGTKMGYTSVTECTHLQIVRFWLKGSPVALCHVVMNNASANY